jgi:hypothetical protein
LLPKTFADEFTTKSKQKKNEIAVWKYINSEHKLYFTFLNLNISLQKKELLIANGNNQVFFITFGKDGTHFV